MNSFHGKKTKKRAEPLVREFAETNEMLTYPKAHRTSGAGG